MFLSCDWCDTNSAAASYSFLPACVLLSTLSLIRPKTRIDINRKTVIITEESDVLMYKTLRYLLWVRMSTCVKEQLRTFSQPDSLDIVQSSYEKTVLVFLFQKSVLGFIRSISTGADLPLRKGQQLPWAPSYQGPIKSHINLWSRHFTFH